MISETVALALRSLPVQHREVLVETCFRDRSVNDAARVLGLPVDVVKLRVYHALRALHAALEGSTTGSTARI